MWLVGASGRGAQALATAWMSPWSRGDTYISCLASQRLLYTTLPWLYLGYKFQQGWGRCMQGWRRL